MDRKSKEETREVTCQGCEQFIVPNTDDSDDIISKTYFCPECGYIFDNDAIGFN